MNIKWIIERRVGILQSPVSPVSSNKTVSNLVEEGFGVVVTVADYGFNLSWRSGSPVSIRHYQCTFGDYPQATSWELQHLNEFFLYEIAHGRNVALWCESALIERVIINSIGDFFNLNGTALSELIQIKLDSQTDRAREIPEQLTHCKACKNKRCITDMICHVSSIIDAEEILGKGVILSATKARQRTGKDLALEDRNAAGDPPDYFEYVMFTFGNCIAGDNLVMERSLGRSATAEELEYNFKPGVRFYFNYLDLVDHPGFRSDGYHYCKIKDSVDLNDYLMVVIAPESAKVALSKSIGSSLKNQLVFINQNEYSDLYSWSQKAYKKAIEYKGK